MIRLLIRGGEATKDQNVLVRNLEKTAAFEADPICIFFDLKIESLPLLSTFEVKFLYQISSLTSIEASNNIER
jgi:hypothetical protein